MNKKYIFDADVARSAGTTDHPVSRGCREALQNALNNKDLFVACKDLMTEWRTHKSIFSSAWLSTMIARKQFQIVKHNDEIKTIIKMSSADEKTISIAIKDSHLVDNFNISKGSIVSRDENAKNAISSIPEIKAHINNMEWINPTK